MRHVFASGMAALAVLFGAVSAQAQHTLAAKFDLTKPLTLTGTVTQVDWANPYVHVLMKVPGQPLPTLWAVEVEGPIVLADNGWSETSLTPGESSASRDSPRATAASRYRASRWSMTRTGRPVYVGTNGTPRPRPAATGPTPRWPDGRPDWVRRRGRPATGDIRAAASLVEDGVNVQMDRYGLLNNIADAPKVAPMQPWALGLYRLRQSTFLQRDPMLLCVQAARRPASVPAALRIPVRRAAGLQARLRPAGRRQPQPPHHLHRRPQAGRPDRRERRQPAVLRPRRRPLGRRHVRRRHARLQRGVLVRQRRAAAHRAAADDRTLHTRRHGDDAVRSDDRRSGRVHAAVEEQVDI